MLSNVVPHESLLEIRSIAGTRPLGQRRAPTLYSQHVQILRVYQFNCPNCGKAIENSRTGVSRFDEDDLSTGCEIECGTCSAVWSIAEESLRLG
jgi:transcription elongation factor Elf1